MEHTQKELVVVVGCIRLPLVGNIQLVELRESVLEGFALYSPAKATSGHTAEAVADEMQ